MLDSYMKGKKIKSIKVKFKRKALTSKKAKTILKEGTAKGQPLTSKQKKFFGFVAGGGTPTKVRKSKLATLAERYR